MPKKITYDCETGETVTEEMTGDELAAHERIRATPDPKPLKLDDLIAAAVEKALKARGIA